MTQPMQIDFVSDVSCPWCVIGLFGLEQALERTRDLVAAEIRFQPFELNPHMPREGQNTVEHVMQKYGSTPAEIDANRERIRERAAEVGFAIRYADDSRIYNTFDAHRLLHWAKLEGRQPALKHALFSGYFTEGLDVSDQEVLAGLAERAGLDRMAAREVLSSGRYAAEVRDAEARWRENDINAVPAVIINGRYLISGGQPPEAFEQAIRKIAAMAAD